MSTRLIDAWMRTARWNENERRPGAALLAEAQPSRRTPLTSLALGVGLALATAVTVVPTAQAATLRWAAQNDILTLDPHSQNHSTTNTIAQQGYEGLTRYDKTYQVEPALATKWTQTSPTQWRFELRKGVKFHDGTPFTADDVVFSFGRIRQPNGTMHPFIAGITEIRKVDSHTVDLILAAPNPILLRQIVDFRIMSKTWAEKNKATNLPDFKSKEETVATRAANGTGPYRITGWQPDQRITMVQNKDWWDAKNATNVEEIIYTPIKSDPTRVAALISGDVDLLTDIPTQDVARLRSDGRLGVLEGNEVRTIFIGLDQGSDQLKNSSVQGKNPFKDKRVREALSIAIDREALKRATMRGLSVPAGIMVAPGVNGNTPDIDLPAKADIERARKLLAEAGYPNGFEVPFNCPNNRYVNDEEICVAVTAMWTKIGVKARLQTESFSTYSPKLQAFEYQLFLYGWGVPTYDALYTLQSLTHTRTGGADGSGNYFRISDAKLDQIIDAAKVEGDVSKRNALLREGLLRLRDEVLLIPIHHQVRPWAMKKSVQTVHRSDDRPEGRFTTMK
ncbi:ABC transporter substrate-binding protein [Roseateles amylovorans]|uniref:ABC transporter substrate-binding protein n=1 Tax=Roseateles amylovorans TaxID=2978473 RepID=A0ABY6AWW3_9BURK|nr:ABC transporter substrate-binding protein [Roseateles amylovorans]UXH77085.1 ABC transporter substrate-binding protein [Roseateles amylovorans]